MAISLYEKRLRALNRLESELSRSWLSSPALKAGLEKRIRRARTLLSQTPKPNPSRVIPRNKWISGKVKVDSKGKIHFKSR